MKPDCQKVKLAEIHPHFNEKLKEHNLPPLGAEKIEILQLNITRKCNLNCKHCHVQADYTIEGHMPRKIMEKCLEIAALECITTIDITGGAPELNPDLEWFLTGLGRLGKRVIVRTNLVILKEKKYSKFPDLYAAQRIELCASLPFYEKEKYEKQRGNGIFDSTIAVLQDLNRLGYGRQGSGLVIDLVHNPVGAYLSADQKLLEKEYRKNLKEKYGIDFNNLFTINNMPIGRYLEYLIDTDNFTDYNQDLIQAFNPLAAANAMCTITLSVGIDGTFYNCDFNQMLEMPLKINGKSNISELTESDLLNIPVLVDNHCYGCAAGAGSSCQGATA